jgi:hypothetical protein
VLTAAGVLVGLWLVAVAYVLLDAALAMGDGTDALRSVRRRADISELLGPDARADVDRAERRFDRASSRLDSVLLAPLRVVPVVSRHVSAARSVAHGAHDSTRVARSTLEEMDRLVERPHRTGEQRLDLLRDLADVAREAGARLQAIEVASPDALVSTLGDAVAEMSARRADAVRGARDLATVSSALADVLDGPEPYLLLGANNAEMRNGTGMFLSAATLRLDGGDLDLGEVLSTAETVLPEGSVPATGDLAANWPWLEPGRDLRNLGLSADLPQSAPLAIANWAKVPGGARTAGVIVVDVDAMRALLRAVGPVEVDGVRYTSDTVRGLLLRDQYSRFADDRDERRDQLGLVARRIFERLKQGRWEVDELATQLSEAVQGRHLMVWSQDPAVQRAWRVTGADGHLTRRSLSIGFLNRAADKLDSWVDTSADVRFSRAGRGRTRISITYRIENTCTPENCSGPPYVVGPNIAGLQARDHRGLVVANLPRGTTDIELTGTRQFLAAGDGPTETVGGEVTVRSGATVTVTVTGLLPAGIEDLVVEPSARIEPTTWRIAGRTFDTDRRRTVDVTTG